MEILPETKLKDLKNIQGKFYSDSTTLKEGSQDFNEFLSMLPKDNTDWTENCSNCKVPMDKVLVSDTAALSGIVDSVSGIVLDEIKNGSTLRYLSWRDNPVVKIDGYAFWFCRGCESVWKIIDGAFWIKVSVSGDEKFEADKIKKLSIPEVKKMEETPIDMGEKSSEDTTPCPNCHVWRTIEPYSETHIQHVCPKCGAVDLFLIPLEEQSSQDQS